MKSKKSKPLPAVAVAAFGWLLPGGGYLLARRYIPFAMCFTLVCGAFCAGVFLNGSSLWPQPAELAGADAVTALLAKGGALVKMMAGLPYVAARALDYSHTFLEGQVNEYGTKLLIIAGLLNLLALADTLERRRAEAK